MLKSYLNNQTRIIQIRKIFHVFIENMKLIIIYTNNPFIICIIIIYCGNKNLSNFFSFIWHKYWNELLWKQVVSILRTIMLLQFLKKNRSYVFPTSVSITEEIHNRNKLYFSYVASKRVKGRVKSKNESTLKCTRLMWETNVDREDEQKETTEAAPMSREPKRVYY